MNSSAPIPFLFDFKLIEKITFALNVFESFLISYSKSRRENIYSYPRNMKRLKRQKVYRHLFLCLQYHSLGN